MRRVATWMVIGWLVGCSDRSEEAKPAAAPPPAPAPATAADGGLAAVAPAPDAAPPPFLPADLDEKSGIIFAEKVGGTVKGIKDGTLVAVVAESGGAVGDMADATVTIKHEGKKVKLRADRVLRQPTVEAIHRSPDNQHAVFAAIVACGDLCHSVIWLIRTADGKRVKLGEGGPDVDVAWHPKGGTVAVGSANLWIVSLADFKVKEMEAYRSPAYSPAGVLYVRDEGGSAFTLGKGKPVRVWDSGAGKEEGGGDGVEEEEEMGADDPKPVEFVDGKPKFDLEYFPH